MLRSIPILVLALLSIAGMALADSNRILETDEHGARVVKSTTDEQTPLATLTENEAQGGGRDLLWQRTVSPNIYSSTQISFMDYIIAGAESGSPANIEYLMIDSNLPQWTYDCDDNYVAAADMAEMFVAVVANGAISGASVHAFGYESNVPIWTVDFPDCSIPERCIQVSEHGDIVAVSLNTEIGGNRTRLVCLDGETGATISTFDGDIDTWARALRLTADGGLALIRAGAPLYVVDTATGDLIWTGNSGASAGALAFSPDGHWIASGWTYLLVWEWTGSNYAFRYSYNGGATNRYLGACGFSYDGTLMAGFYTTNYDGNHIAWFDPGASTPSWTWTAPTSGGDYQDIPRDIEIDGFGSLGVVGSWGDMYNENPEIMIFGPSTPEPILTVNTPGSIFDVDIQSIGTTRGIVSTITACGKHVHANLMGNGGDLYAIGITTSAVQGETPAPSRSDLSAHPNPFNPKTTLRFSLTETAHIELDIFTPDGRRVRHLASERRDAGEHAFIWDGRDDSGGELPSGVYLASLKGLGEIVSSRLVMLR